MDATGAQPEGANDPIGEGDAPLDLNQGLVDELLADEKALKFLRTRLEGASPDFNPDVALGPRLASFARDLPRFVMDPKGLLELLTEAESEVRLGAGAKGLPEDTSPLGPIDVVLAAKGGVLLNLFDSERRRLVTRVPVSELERRLRALAASRREALRNKAPSIVPDIEEIVFPF